MIRQWFSSRELAAAFVQEQTRKGAEELYQQRVELGQPGTPEGDWFGAQQLVVKNYPDAWWRAKGEEVSQG